MTKLKIILDPNRLFTYIVAHDGGSAPNPFHNMCTLAICKPAIRRVAKTGDVIVGLSRVKDESHIVYCMLVDETVSWSNYIKLCSESHDSRYKLKIPHNQNDQGDCIWKDADNYSDAIPSWSGHGGEHDYNRDIKNGENVLIGEIFWYFGKGDQYKISLPDNLKNIIPGRGHRSNSNNSFRDEFVNFFNNELENRNILKIGKMGTPELEPEKTDKRACSRYCAEERESDAHGEEY